MEGRRGDPLGHQLLAYKLAGGCLSSTEHPCSTISTPFWWTEGISPQENIPKPTLILSCLRTAGVNSKILPKQHLSPSVQQNGDGIVLHRPPMRSMVCSNQNFVGNYPTYTPSQFILQYLAAPIYLSLLIRRVQRGWGQFAMQPTPHVHKRDIISQQSKLRNDIASLATTKINPTKETPKENTGRILSAEKCAQSGFFHSTNNLP